MPFGLDSLSGLPGFVPNQITPVTADALVSALAAAYKSVTGSRASKEILALMVGQVALETGGEGGTLTSIHNWNLGNARGTYNGKWTSYRAHEYKDGKKIWLEASPTNKFRAYDNLVESAEDYIRVLRAKPHWWQGLQTGTVEGFVRGLTTWPAYFTGNAPKYASLIVERSAKYQDYIVKNAKGFGIGAAILAGIGLGAGYHYARRRT